MRWSANTEPMSIRRRIFPRPHGPDPAEADDPPLIVLDSTLYLAKDPNHAISLVDLRAWEERHGRVPKGSFVALRTDMYKDWDNPERFKRRSFPACRLRQSSSCTNSAA